MRTNETQTEPRLLIGDGEELYANYADMLQMQQLYTAVIREITTKLEILNDEFRVLHARNPIQHIESRMKSPRSIIAKLKKLGKPVNTASAQMYLNDVAGIRVVCGYIDDVYAVADMLLRQTDITLLKRQDYIAEPNFNGYRSLHLDVQIPIFFSERTEMVTAEIQIRTVAMDFWASLEHDIRYKNPNDIPKELSDEMFACAERIAAIDREMQDMYRRVQALDDK